MYHDDTSVRYESVNDGLPSDAVPGNLARVSTARSVIDYALKRRALLADVRSGRASLAEACDAHPYLKLAARHYGEDAGTGCPVCNGTGLRYVHYVYGDALGNMAGQAKHVRELEFMQDRFREFSVYVVEVCRDCGWNHLIRTFVLGRDGTSDSGLPTAADG
jgi:hypothetical protein